MRVKDLIEFLQTQPKDLTIVYRCCSEQCILDIEDIELKNLCKPRPDGWVQDARSDKDLMPYLVFPGN
jgi:hypothetical protein